MKCRLVAQRLDVSGSPRDPLQRHVGAGLGERRALPTSSRTYPVLNLVGSAVLAMPAVYEKHLGFLLLQACWVSAPAEN
jgi:hypothetical protein